MPVRTILVTIGLVLATGVLIYLVKELAHIEALLVISAFFATVLTPVVDLVSRRLHLKRGLAAGLVFVAAVGLVAWMMYTFISPVVAQTQHLVDNVPRYLSDARAGRGPVGEIVKRFNLDQRFRENQQRISASLSGAGSRAVDLAGRVVNGVVSLLTVLVLTFMMVLYGPDLLTSGMAAVSPERRRRITAVGADCAKALTGYVTGNILISLVAGSLTFVALLTFGVPFRAVLALWVGFADLIPLVGASLGALPTILVAFLHSVPAGIGVTIFFVLYQQFENHVLQPVVMSRTVQINQLFVLVSVLVGVELFGILGALLAIPAAGVVQVVARDVWDHRRGRMKTVPTVGEDEVPVRDATAPGKT